MKTYNAQVQATGGVPPYKWSLAPNTKLPTGVTFDTTQAVFSGIPAQQGNFQVGVQVTDSVSKNGSNKNLTLQVVQPLSVGGGALGGASLGTSYSTTLGASGGTTPYKWQLSGGALPSGLTLGSTGMVSGTPTSIGTFSFTATATDSAARVASGTYTLAVSDSLVQITSTSLPSGQTGTAYQSSVSATGGSIPYTWSVSSGSLPSGLTLNASTGTISGTPTTAGTYAVTLSVTDAMGRSASSQFSVVIAAAVLALQISTSALPDGVIGVPYSSTLSAAGGTAPYSWTITSGTLPGSLAFGATTGSIDGTPSVGGSYPLSFTVTDSKNATASASLALNVSSSEVDKYGGLISLASPNGGTGSWRTEKFGNRWLFVTPAGHGFFMQGIFLAAWDGGTDYQGVNDQTVLQTKYATGSYGSWTLNWANQTLRRMQAWGFNTTGEYARYELLPTNQDSGWKTADSSAPIKLPFITNNNGSLSVAAMRNDNSWATGYTKGFPTGVKLSVSNLNQMWHSFADGADPFDTNWKAYVTGYMAKESGIAQVTTNTNHDYLMGLVMDDSDFLSFTRCGSDFQDVRSGVLQGFAPTGNCAISFGYFTAISSPVQSVGDSSRDELLGTHGLDALYTDTKFYAKSELAAWLQGTADRGPGYTSIAALNAAWGSRYSTFGSSATPHTGVTCATANGTVGPFTCTIGAGVDPLSLQVFAGTTMVAGDSGNGATAATTSTVSKLRGPTIDNANSSINYSNGTVTIKFLSSAPASGTVLKLNYNTGGWGVGTGLLDEDGKCPSSGGSACWLPSNAFNYGGSNAAVQQDLENFLYHFAKSYFGSIKTALTAAHPGFLYMGPTGMGTMCAPPRAAVLEAAGETLDVLTFNTLPCGASDDQARIDFVSKWAGDKPWIQWEGFTANADSYMSPYANYGGTEARPSPETQANRGASYSTMVNRHLGALSTVDNSYHVIGFRWWQLYDNRGEQLNWGLITRRDNPYDGHAATTAAGTDQWGYSTGGEKANYGDFITSVTNANSAWKTAPTK